MNIPEITDSNTYPALDPRKLTEILYQGAWPADEDPADYYRPLSIQAVRVG
ncbi:hypothetical protein CHCC19466_0022 [Bacillus licheniformis]|nr:hypothetical protein CHCC19466_0022 [Bacillus licheniformis]TWL92750.1 hypothetical protein CHCC15291_4698 [Bacillus licheniformis]TWM05900.1 hypothetical protein CHCC15289_1797 [Bacillus licheniformis]GIN27927.1 hypothetical protein J31TS2_45070 [Bacillus licheniformis]GIN32466.1 hypothetical protein J2TS5_45050 [Bacillus licheniformis]